LNRAVADAATVWRDRPDLALIVQTGRDAHAEVAAAYAGVGEGRARVLPYIDAMPAVLRWADLVVCRAGAMTLAELAATGRPAVLVPFPHATDDHQLRNARAREAAGVAVVLEDRDCDGPALVREVDRLAADVGRLGAMGRASAALARPQAAEEIAAGVLGLASASSTG
jgi:UDP-N-acetylglucosamine--N-acetylmuramyl-(pentapeptide) pyrophosphoryl-undecaprenol N-acetylglucosamine transferase